ncbi:MAG: TonB-dependent receptor [Pseudomonadota bacterium]
MTPRQALDVLLQGTGLKADFLGADGATISQAVSSQLATGDDELIGEDIIVQGELQARSLQDTQTSVIVITGEEFERRSDKDIYDIYQRTAGVMPGTNGRDLVIRGIQRNGLGFGGGATISTRIDGADVSSAGRFRNLDFSTWDLEQVEIFRGPQSTQSGRNALAGVVDIRSKDPVFDFEAKARAEFGSGPTGAASFAVNVPIVEDTLALRVSVDRDQSAGFIENTTRQSDNYGDSELTTLRGSVRFDPFDNLSTVLKYTYLREERGGESLDGATFPDQRISTQAFRDFSTREGNALNFRLNWDIDDHFRLENDTSYLRTNGTVVSAAGTGEANFESFEQELKLRYQSDWLNGVIGGFLTQIDENDVIDGGVFSFDTPTRRRTTPPSARSKSRFCHRSG